MIVALPLTRHMGEQRRKVNLRRPGRRLAAPGMDIHIDEDLRIHTTVAGHVDNVLDLEQIRSEHTIIVALSIT